VKTPKTGPLMLVIIGRPNVGKSTLFNRLFGRRRALVHDMPGVTRDRLEEAVEWKMGGKTYPILLVDTGGLGGERFAEEIENQVNIALESADVVVMLFDGKEGLTTLDQELIQNLQRRGVHRKAKLIGVVNKVDANVHEDRINDFYETGLDPLLTISADHNRGIDDLKMAVVEVGELQPLEGSSSKEDIDQESDDDFEDNLEDDSDAESDDEDFDKSTDDDSDEESEVEDLDESDSEDGDSDDSEDADELEDISELEDEPEPAERRIPKVAILGKPNVGKSTLINALLGEQRMITSPIAGTTVDSIDSTTTLNGLPFLLIDTAGIRRKNKTEQGIEVLSVVQSRKALERADVAVLLLDGEEGIAEQDEKIGGLIEEVGCGVILMMNKWDTQRTTGFTKEDAAERIRGKMAYLKYAPILFVSAKRNQGLDDLGDLIEEIIHQRRLKIPTREFTEWVRKEATIHNPMNARFYLCHQSGRFPPTFVCHVSDPDKVHFSLRRHIINAMRERWGFMGSPLRLLFVKGAGNRPAPKRKSKKGSNSKFR
jgi:GTPase